MKSLSLYASGAFKEDIEKEWAAEHGLQIAIQVVIDIGAHILAEAGESGIEDYADIIERLGRTAVLPEDFSNSIKGMTGFRNVLVHEYTEVDVDRVYDMLKNRLDDFRRFVGYINKYMEDSDK